MTSEEEPHARHETTPGSNDMVSGMDHNNHTHGSNGNAPMTVREYRRNHKRLIAAFIALCFFVLVGNGLGWSLYSNLNKGVCHERNERAVAAGRALKQLEQAAIADNDPYQSLVWHQYNEATKSTPLPKC
jgi:hypothetical protein